MSVTTTATANATKQTATVTTDSTVTQSDQPAAQHPAFREYLARCARDGTRDLCGLQLTQVVPFLKLNQYQKDALSKKVPMEQYRLFRSAVELIEKDMCVTCWLTNSTCMCNALRDWQCRHRVFILMHEREFGRGSNTGKIAVRAANMQRRLSRSSGGERNTDALVSESSAATHSHSPIAPIELLSTNDLTRHSAMISMDIPAQMQALIDLCHAQPLNTIVLYPSDQAITVEELRQLRGWTEQRQMVQEQSAESIARPSSPSSSSQPACPNLNIILLDGTWRQARHMKSILPSHIPAIKIDPLKYKLDGTLRPQKVELDESQPEKVSTTNVAALAAPSSSIAGGAAATPAPSSVEAVAVAASAATTDASTEPISRLSPFSPHHLDGKQAPVGTSFVSLFYPLRKQSQPDRISTLEALVVLLKELDESAETTHFLLDMLRVLVDSMRVQSGMNCVYDTFNKQQCRVMRSAIAQSHLRRARVRHEMEHHAALTDAASANPSPSESLFSSPSPSPSLSASPSSSVIIINARGSIVPACAAALQLSRRERKQRQAAMRPCLQWNRPIIGA